MTLSFSIFHRFENNWKLQKQNSSSCRASDVWRIQGHQNRCHDFPPSCRQRRSPKHVHHQRTDGKHMLHLDRDSGTACTNGHVRRLMHVSSPTTRIQRTHLQHRRWEPSDYFYDLCRDAGINKGCTHTCTPTHARTHVEHHYWRLLLHFSWSLLSRENDFQFHLTQPWKKHRDLAVMTKAISSRVKDSACRPAAWRVCTAAWSETFHWPCFGCAVLSRFGNWWPADKNQFQSGWVGTK